MSDEIFEEIRDLGYPLTIDGAEQPEEHPDKTYYQAGYNKAISDVVELLKKRWES